jgi:SAM-dependent methyltransferase
MSGAQSIQVTADHYDHGYDGPGRWSSYWVQIESMRDMVGDGKALEVGVGNSTVANYLRRVLQIPLTTVDIDPELQPDHLASITDLPFTDRQFTVVAACEVLEHLPFDQAEVALRELRRVAESAVISVPNPGRTISLTLGLNPRRHTFHVDVSWLGRRTEPVVKDQHYWELGMRRYELRKFRRLIRRCGWEIVRDFRNDDFAMHHFFIPR